RSGKRLWAFPDSPIFEKTAINSTDNKEEFFQQPLVERIWEDSLYGIASSDGQRVYFVPQPGYSLEVSEESSSIAKYPFRLSNELCALDVDRQGALSWKVGGDTGCDEPKLAKAFFLGAPLVLDSDLYAICVLEKQIRLVVLDSRNGQQKWTVQLATLDISQDIRSDRFRRLRGAMCSYSDGIVVCSTGVGALIGVDVSARSVIWGYQYTSPSRRNVDRIAPQLRKLGKLFSGLWADGTVVIDDGRVIHTPVESQDLVCVRLRTGEPAIIDAKTKKLTSRMSRGDGLILGCVENGRAIIVGELAIRAMDLRTGKLTWNKKYGDLGKPSGRGYANQGFYYQPFTTRKIAKIKLDDGKIVAVEETNGVLGNLVSFQGDIVSHSATEVSVYPQDQPSYRYLQSTDVGQNDLRTASLQAQLWLREDNFDLALEKLKSAYQSNQDFVTEGQLLDLLMIEIEKDFDSGMKKAAGFEDLLKIKRPYPFLVAQIKGLLDRQNPNQVLKLLFETLESVQGSEIPKQLIEQKDQVVNGNAKETNHPVEIVLDDWIGGRIREVFRQVDSATQIEIRNRVANLVAKIKNPNQAFRFLASLGFDLVVEESCLQLAMKLIQAESFLRASSLLKSLTQSEDKEMATKAANLQLQIATKNGMQRQAKLMSAEFKKRDLKVAQQYAEEIESWESDNPDSISPTILTEIWQSGEVKLQESQNTELASTPLSGNSVIVLSTDNPEVRDYTFQFYPQTGELSVKDAYGVEFRRFSARKKLSRVLTVYNRYWKGRLIVRENFALMDFGREIFAFDWIRLIAGEDPYLWSTKLTGKGVAYMPSVSQKRTWGTTEIVSGIGDFQDRLLIGSVGLNGVCYLDNSQLVCLDAYTGERRWQKKVDSSESTVFGGARHVVVWNGRDRTALVIETATGRSLSICKVPVEAGSIWKNFGSKILLSAKIRSAGNSKEPVGPLEDRDHKRLMLFDLTTGKPVWTKRFEESTLGTPVADNQFAFLDARCRYRVMDVVSGVESEPIEIPELKPMRPKITGIAVSNYQGKHLIHFRRGNLTENRISLPLLKAEVRYIQFADKMWEG
ncbi:MAG: PQQ-binding-like beta-propeller repeat protein, partial [Planctomycetota bacterium]